MNAAKVIRFILMECNDLDIKWWTDCLDTIARTRDVERERYDDFVHTLNLTVRRSIGAPWPDLLKADLSDAEKCFVMCVVDSFMDVWICTSGNIEEWKETWPRTQESLLEIAEALETQAMLVKPNDVKHAWHRLVSAAS